MSVRTERLVIDRLVAEDIPTIVAYRNQPEVAEHQGWDLPFRPSAAERLVAASVGSPLEDGQLAIRLADGALIGDLMAVVAHNTSHAFELGVSLRREQWGNGYATEALTAVIDELFSAPFVERVQAYVSVHNQRSRTLFQRLGFVAEGQLSASFRRSDGSLVDEVLFATVRARWCHPGGTDCECGPHPADVAELSERLDESNQSRIGRRDGQALAVFHREAHGRPSGGVTGYTWAGIGHLDVVWLEEHLRGRGVGRELLTLAEEEMRRRGASAVYVETYSFQAPGFYERLGYERVASVEELPPGQQHIVLRKVL